MASISELTMASNLSVNDMFEISIVNALMESGYESNSATVQQLASFIVNSMQFASALNTTTKTITGAINEVLQSAGGGLELTSTLTAGSTSLTFQNVGILTTSTFDFYTDVWGVNPTAVAVVGGSLTLTFDTQDSDISVKVVVK